MSSPTDHFANERTFLAWVRTGIALIAFGFVVAKFAIFLQILKDSTTIGSGTVVYGEVMILLGAMTIVYGTYSYVLSDRQLWKDHYKPRIRDNIVFSALVIIVVLIMSVLLIL